MERTVSQEFAAHIDAAIDRMHDHEAHQWSTAVIAKCTAEELTQRHANALWISLNAPYESVRGTYAVRAEMIAHTMSLRGVTVPQYRLA